MRNLRLVTALVAFFATTSVTAKPARAADPVPNLLTLCELSCGAATVTCNSIHPGEFCLGFFAGCMTGCGF